MPEPDLIELFAQPLNQAGVRYFVSGSVAAMLYGEPRVTHDIDIRSMLAVSGDLLDRSALQDWVARLGLKTEWQLVTE